MKWNQETVGFGKARSKTTSEVKRSGVKKGSGKSYF
jgi:hypothetical protein